MSRHDRDLFTGLRRPPAPEGLKARALEAARTALVEASPAPGLAECLWASRRLRLAWAVAVALLLSVHLYLVAVPSSPQATVSAVSEPQDGPEPLPEDPDLLYLIRRYSRPATGLSERLRPYRDPFEVTPAT
ncbi:MAG: hypothetical protein GY856_41495 [bacterium]|nr:hypothetical protein [bacterium]